MGTGGRVKDGALDIVPPVPTPGTGDLTDQSEAEERVVPTTVVSSVQNESGEEEDTEDDEGLGDDRDIWSVTRD